MAEVRTLLVVGATSDIGRAIARKLAAEGWALQLAARDPVQLTREAQDLRVRSAAAVSCHHCDVLEAEGGASLLDELDPLPDAAVCVVGDAGGQRESPPGGAAAERIMRTNYIGPALLMAALAERFAQRGSGVLVGVSSVAGDRGRARNYVYGSAKAGFTAFLSGLRNRLHGAGVHVITVKPGYVHTRKTEGDGLAPAADRSAGRGGCSSGKRHAQTPGRGLCAGGLAPDHVGCPRHPGAIVQAAATLIEDAWCAAPHFFGNSPNAKKSPDRGRGFSFRQFRCLNGRQRGSATSCRPCPACRRHRQGPAGGCLRAVRSPSLRW